MLYTAAEIGRRITGLGDVSAGVVGTATSAAAPTDAVQSFVDALADKDLAAATARLAPFEARLVADYESTIGAELLADLETYDLDVTLDHVAVVDEPSASRAIVEVDVWSAAIAGEDQWGDPVDESVTVDGWCAEHRSLRWNGEYEGSAACAFERSTGLDLLSVYRDLGWNGPRFVVVEGDDGWSVSLLHTAMYLLRPAASDRLHLAATVELVDDLLGGLLEYHGYYEFVIPLLATNAAVLGDGQNVHTPPGAGRAVIFAVEASETTAATIDAEADAAVCIAWVVWLEGSYLRGTGDDCGTPLELETDGWLIVSSSEHSPFTGLEPLGEVRITVQR